MDPPKNRSKCSNTMLGKTSAKRNLGYRGPKKSLGQVYVSAKPVRLALKAAKNQPRAVKGGHQARGGERRAGAGSGGPGRSEAEIGEYGITSQYHLKYDQEALRALRGGHTLPRW
jgi:hypothetical protein